MQVREWEFRTVRVGDIAELPWKLGDRCLLLWELGLNPYRNTEEELCEVLEKTLRRRDILEICFRYSSCRAFYEAFVEGRTPFAERDPILFCEYEEKYWVVEGKHRVCLAIRAGVGSLEARVRRMRDDSMLLLPPEGGPGCFRFACTYPAKPGGRESARGTVGYLWAGPPAGEFLGWSSFRWGDWLDDSSDTGGEWVELLPGLRYRVSVNREKAGFFRRAERFQVEAEVVVVPGHKKTKIWLLEMPVSEAPIFRRTACCPRSFRTLYRCGRWRRGHLYDLSRLRLRWL